MDIYFINPNDIGTFGNSDSESIQKAVDIASSSGCNKVVIPRCNTRTGSEKWVIDKTILLPDNMTVVLDNCLLQLADDAACNVFSNSNIYTELGKTLEGEQTDINIIGEGNAVIDGGNYNGLSERNSLKDGRPHISRNTPILFVNVNRFRISNFRVINQRWWGMTYIFCRNGKISDIDFKADLSRVDENGVHYPDQLPENYGEIYIKNADGVDLRVGCNNITIENITGFTEDDTVALTALTGKNFESKLLVEGKDTDIHDVAIRNIKADCYCCATVRLLNSDGNKLYNVIIDGVEDISEHPSHTTIRLNDNAYTNIRPVEHGEMSNIIVSNVISRGAVGVAFSSTLKDALISNLIMHGPNCINAVRNNHTGKFENILIDKIIVDTPNEEKTAVNLINCEVVNVKVKNVITPDLKCVGVTSYEAF